ncbi:hypothetical protein J6590_026599 [Homalodisca vitripennis]|nr:hypothetical protein J6590_026599 [Homalodisca vitripennis]
MEGINTELLIDEVKKREAIWNSSSETYKDRVLKKNQWSQLCSIFCSNFEDQTPKEKTATSLLPPPSIFCIRTTENSRRTI